MTEPRSSSEGRPDDAEQDVITFGRRPAARPAQRKALILAAVGIVIAGILAALLVTRDRHHPTAAQGASQSGVSPTRSVVTSPTESNGTELHGGSLTGVTNAQVLVTLDGGATPVWINIDTRARTLISVPPSGLGYGVTAFSTGALLQPGSTQPCSGCPGNPVPVFYAPVGSAVAARVGTTNGDVAVAADARAVWLSMYRFPTRPTQDPDQVVTVREVDFDGRALRPVLTLPLGYALDRMSPQPVDGSLLLERQASHMMANGYALWNPSQRRILRTFHAVIAVSENQVAWTDNSCSNLGCKLHLTNLRAGTAVVKPLPSEPAYGVYSPDGEALALLVRTPGAGAVDTYLLDEHDGAVDRIAHTTVDTRIRLPLLTWTSDGRWILITSFGNDDQAGLVDTGTRQLYVAPLPTN